MFVVVSRMKLIKAEILNMMLKYVTSRVRAAT